MARWIRREETMRLPKYEELPAWFRKSVRQERKHCATNTEGAARGTKFVANGQIVLSVSGSTWALFSGLSALLQFEEVADPLYALTPSIPVCVRLGGEGVTLVMHMGYHIFVQADYHALIVGVYGPRLEWFGSAPNSPVVVKSEGETMAIVMPCYPTTDEEREPWHDAARDALLKRNEDRKARKR